MLEWFLRPQHRLADDVKCNIIETVDALAQLVDDFSEHIGLMSRLFKPGNGMLTRQSRTKLAKLFVTIGSLPKTNWLKDTAKLIMELTAYNDHTIDSFDYDKRLGAMTVYQKIINAIYLQAALCTSIGLSSHEMHA